MTETPRPQHTDMQALSDSSADVYEAIATLEFTGRTVSRSQIASATRLNGAAVAEALGILVGQGFVLERAGDGEPVYMPARRGWSAAPAQATGKPLSPGSSPRPSDAGAAPASAEDQASGRTDDAGAQAARSTAASDLAAGKGTSAPIQGWTDSGSITVISWSTADGRAFQREVADPQESARLLQSIEDDDQLALVSAQVRRVGIGPDS
jgi:hypothetical protein